MATASGVCQKCTYAATHSNIYVCQKRLLTRLRMKHLNGVTGLLPGEVGVLVVGAGQWVAGGVVAVVKEAEGDELDGVVIEGVAEGNTAFSAALNFKQYRLRVQLDSCRHSSRHAQLPHHSHIHLLLCQTGLGVCNFQTGHRCNIGTSKAAHIQVGQSHSIRHAVSQPPMLHGQLDGLLYMALCNIQFEGLTVRHVMLTIQFASLCCFLAWQAVCSTTVVAL